jgi:hypothetical protein
MAVKNNNDADLLEALARELSKLKPEDREKILKKLNSIKESSKNKPEIKK